MTLEDPKMETEILGHDDRDCGVKVIDERGHEHRLTIEWDGIIREHGGDEGAYPQKVENRTDEEQRIMSQVEERARYAAQQEFPDADILDPMWDPAHLDRGVEALVDYPLEEFQATFRDFYEVLKDPGTFVDDPTYEPGGELVYKPFAIDADNRIVDVADIAIRYDVADSISQYGTITEYEDFDRIVCVMPPLEFEEDVTFEDQFHEIVVGHVMAQIRDVYLHMGEEPPEEYMLEGIGKINIHGDGLGET